MNKFKLKDQLIYYFKEDIGDLDLTTDSIFKNEEGTVVLTAKSNGYFCGEQIIKTGYQLLDKEAVVQMNVTDGDAIQKGQRLASINGNINTLLHGERVILNMVQRLSGITTKTKKAVQLLNDPKINISDTRKTTPGLRMFEKYAVRVGGGTNHRFRLDDAVLIKDNHIAFCGSITEAVKRVRSEIGHMVKVEVEVENEQQLKEAIAANVDVIMLDNMEIDELRRLLEIIPSEIIVELSGGISISDLPKYRSLKVDVISLGCLTHQIESLDLSMNTFSN
ncbi:carboxylating nicotinate-nucleotide diphosphorylase [Alkalibacillus aidingensis]|uniref:carboxylating nicotinate-nucleotide diphosphorylase n=1 Tax=Alkalibacillus aidingensis TaxID=2747607 RepID=UPI001660E4C5|nr:carboxylating nicotinate-nucleotide diphosphorylase [Alkalibacillus aidingensis]